MRHDRDCINVVRRRMADLEQTVLADREELPDTVDAGWDSESLRRDFGGGEA